MVENFINTLEFYKSYPFDMRDCFTSSLAIMIVAMMTFSFMLFLLNKHEAYVQSRIHQHMVQMENPLNCENYYMESARETCKVNMNHAFNQNQFVIKKQIQEVEKTSKFIHERLEYHKENISVNSIMFREIIITLNRTSMILDTALKYLVQYDETNDQVQQIIHEFSIKSIETNLDTINYMQNMIHHLQQTNSDEFMAKKIQEIQAKLQKLSKRKLKEYELTRGDRAKK